MLARCDRDLAGGFGFNLRTGSGSYVKSCTDGGLQTNPSRDTSSHGDWLGRIASSSFSGREPSVVGRVSIMTLLLKHVTACLCDLFLHLSLEILAVSVQPSVTPARSRNSGSFQEAGVLGVTLSPLVDLYLATSSPSAAPHTPPLRPSSWYRIPGRDFTLEICDLRFPNLT